MCPSGAVASGRLWMCVMVARLADSGRSQTGSESEPSEFERRARVTKVRARRVRERYDNERGLRGSIAANSRLYMRAGRPRSQHVSPCLSPSTVAANVSEWAARAAWTCEGERSREKPCWAKRELFGSRGLVERSVSRSPSPYSNSVTYFLPNGAPYHVADRLRLVLVNPSRASRRWPPRAVRRAESSEINRKPVACAMWRPFSHSGVARK